MPVVVKCLSPSFLVLSLEPLYALLKNKNDNNKKNKTNKKNGGAFAFDAKFLLQINFSIKPF